MLSKPCRLLPSALWALASLPLLAAAPAAAELPCDAIPKLVDQFVRSHVRHQKLTEEIEQRAIETYLRRIDPSRILYSAPEAAELRSSLRGIVQRVRAGDCSRLRQIHADVVRRHGRIAELVRETVSAPDYAIDPTAELVIDADDRGFAATQENWQQLLRSLIHFQMSNYLDAESDLEEAKRRLVRRYEVRQKRLAKRDVDEIYGVFLDAVALGLDPHSNYFSADAMEDFTIQMTLSLTGIGVALAERDGYAVAERIIANGAADRHKGLRPKDKIIAVTQEGGESVDIVDMPLREAVSLIRGEIGTKVGLTVLRQGEKTERLQMTIVRDKIDLEDYAAKLRFEEREVGGKKLKLAVLDLPAFYGGPDPDARQSTQDVARLLAEVESAGADGLVLDLSRNGGGMLEHAVTISGYFLRRGPIVRIANGHGARQNYVDDDDSVLYSGPLVVHTSRVSASASEILAGALKDYRRAVIAGDDHTFGKGTVQTVQELPGDLGALKITTAMFYRPGGKSTQRDGVEAHVVIPSLLADDDIGEKSQRYSLEANRIPPFLGARANSQDGERHWVPVDDEHFAVLNANSRRRVEASEAFAEVRAKLEEQRKNDGVIRLADILKQREEAGADAAAPEAPAGEGDAEAEAEGEASAEAEPPPTPQLEEAIAVLADLVLLQRQQRGNGVEDAASDPELALEL